MASELLSVDMAHFFELNSFMISISDFLKDEMMKLINFKIFNSPS